jgi:hypothetical protein
MDQKREHLENLHIPLWLLKDTCWMMEWKVLGVIMIFPTMILAIRIAVHSFRTFHFLPNLSVCFWIGANAYWMVCEFFFKSEGKQLAMIFFTIGLVLIVFHYIRLAIESRKVATGIE